MYKLLLTGWTQALSFMDLVAKEVRIYTVLQNLIHYSSVFKIDKTLVK